MANNQNYMIAQYLREHATELLHKSEGKENGNEREISKHFPLDSELAKELAGESLFPMKHGDVVGQVDKIHLIWARCLRDALCLGRTSEGKRGRDIYSPQICMEMEVSILKAFIIGREYAIEERKEAEGEPVE